MASSSDDLVKRLARMAKEAPKEIARAMFEEAQILQKEAMRRCPVDTGTLRASHKTERPTIKGDDITVSIVCGGPAAPYALPVHERLDVHHPVGEPKWLERTVMDARPTWTARVLARADKNKLAGG